MAKAKTPARSRSSFSQEKYTAELSPGQLVIGMAILLVFGLACFLLGVIIGKFDPTIQTAKNGQNTSPTRTVEETKIPITSAKTEDIVEEPAPAQPIVKPKADPPPIQKPAVNIARGIPNSAKNETKPTPTQKPIAKKPAASEPTVEQRSKPEDKPKVVAPKNSPVPTNVATKTTQQQERWTVQVASFGVETNARKEQSRLQAKSPPYKVELLAKDSRGYYRLIIGSFTEKASAKKLETQLVKQHKFPTTFVTKRY